MSDKSFPDAKLQHLQNKPSFEVSTDFHTCQHKISGYILWEIHIYIYIYNLTITMEQKFKFLAMYLRAHNRRYDAVLETAPSTNSIVCIS